MKYKELLVDSAKKMVVKGKGILAADESNPTCGKRFEAIGVSPSFETRNEYRDMLMTSEGLENYISGVIMFDEYKPKLNSGNFILWSLPYLTLIIGGIIIVFLIRKSSKKT